MKSRHAKTWTRLDNAAQLYASTSSRRDPKVFRFACELTEPVAPELLQQALERCMKIFPLFRSVLRRGLFWYFLEQTDHMPQIMPETQQPCAPLLFHHAHHFLFTISYFRCRINLDIHHILADGTGALQFLRMLTYHYLMLRHPEPLSSLRPQMDFDASDAEKGDDSFRKYYNGKPVSLRVHSTPAAQLKGARLSGYRFHIAAGEMPVSQTLAHCKAQGATLTAYICARLICAIHGELSARERTKPVVLAVPVNLRNYFESVSARNFFSVFHVSYTFGRGDDSFPSVLREVSRQFSEELTTERLSNQMNRMAALEHNFFSRVIPLALKNISLAIGGVVAAKGVTAGVSNLGRITMPEALLPYIRAFDVFFSGARVQICACSFGDQLMINMTSPFVSTNIQKHFFRAFTKQDIAVTIHAFPLDEEAGEEESDVML